MLASCHISLWGNEKKDSRIESDVAIANKVVNGKAGKWKTNLLVGADAEYESLKQTLGFCRSYHYKTTLRWGKRGEQVLPSELFLDYSKTMLSYRALADQRLSDLCDVWDERVQQAKLNAPSLCARHSYPTPAQLKLLCGVEIEINPLPEAGDLILDIEDGEAQKLLSEERGRMQVLEETRVQEAMGDLWQRFQKILLLAERSLNIMDDGGSSRYRDSWYVNLKEFKEVAKKLNFTDDAKFNELFSECARMVNDHSPEEYEQQLDLREEGAAKVQKILDQMKGIF